MVAFGCLTQRAIPIGKSRDMVLECVHGEHTQLNSQHPAETGHQKAAGQAGKDFRPKLELPHRRCGRVLRGRPGKDAGGAAPGRPTGEVRTLHPA